MRVRCTPISVYSSKLSCDAHLACYIPLMRRLAIYPGSFDPPTLGHLDVVERASRLFDELIVAIGINSNKNPLLSTEERIEALTQSVRHLPNVRIDQFTGLLVDYAREKGAHSIVRGLRATADFEYEFQMAMVNRRLSDDVDQVGTQLSQQFDRSRSSLAWRRLF